MRVIICHILLFVSTLLGAQNVLDQQLDFTVEDLPVQQALLMLSEQSGVPISFGSHLFENAGTVSMAFRQTSLRELLDHCLQDSDLMYQLKNNRLFLRRKPKKYFTISGTVEDARSGEKLIAATIVKKGSNEGVISNEYGFFSLTLEAGQHDIAISYLGYEEEETSIQLQSNKTFTFKIQPGTTLNEVVIYAYDSAGVQGDRLLQKNGLSLQQLEINPKLGGESDLLRAAHQLPGVQTGPDGIGGMNVRGGSVDQNLILLDGIPIYNPSHALGMLSIFNPSTVRNASLIKGGFPARYGGRLSSVLDVRTREGNLYEYESEANVSLVATRLSVEGPIQKGKSAFLLSARRTHVDPLIRGIGNFISNSDESITSQSSNYFLYDFNAKLHFGGEKDRFYFSFYKGRDLFYSELEASFNFEYEEESFVATEFENYLGYNWGNTIGALRWNHTFGNRLFSNTSLTYSQYDYQSSYAISEFFDFEEDDEPLDNISYISDTESLIGDVGLRIDMDFIPGNRHHLKFGSHNVIRNFQPSAFFVDQFSDIEDEDDFNFAVDSVGSLFRYEAIQTTEWNLYLEDEIKINPKLTLNLGLHLSSFFSEEVYYLFPEPRLNLHYRPDARTTYNLAISRMVQYLHVISNNNIGLPNDLWVPTSGELPPQASWQVSAGFRKNLNGWKLSVEGYYKYLQQVSRYPEAASFPSLDDVNVDAFWESDLALGQGFSYGVETMISKSKGRFNGWLSYTLAWANRQFDEINGGEVFPFNFDRRHQLHLNAQYQLSRRWSLSANFNFGSGSPTTLQTSNEELGPFNVLFPTPTNSLGLINDYRMPVFHRLNLAINF
ncbi:MAG: TonB-dependent receptor, partial [Bacteroidota bacterium]